MGMVESKCEARGNGLPTQVPQDIVVIEFGRARWEGFSRQRDKGGGKTMFVRPSLSLQGVSHLKFTLVS